MRARAHFLGIVYAPDQQAAEAAASKSSKSATISAAVSSCESKNDAAGSSRILARTDAATGSARLDDRRVKIFSLHRHNDAMHRAVAKQR
jgi:hypothetical protein